MRCINSNKTINRSTLIATSKRSGVLFGITFVALTMFAGCQSIKNSPLVKRANSFGRKTTNTAPAEKREPFSLDAITGNKLSQPPVRPSSMTGRDSLPSKSASNSATKNRPALNLENVGLGASEVHVEAGTMDDAVDRAKNQLPTFVEAAVHPFGTDTPYTLSDQSNQMPNENVATAGQIGSSMNPQNPIGAGQGGPPRMSLGDNSSNAMQSQQPAALQTTAPQVVNSNTPPITSAPTSAPGFVNQAPIAAQPQSGQNEQPANEVRVVSANEMFAQQPAKSQSMQLGDSPVSQVVPPLSTANLDTQPTTVAEVVPQQRVPQQLVAAPEAAPLNNQIQQPYQTTAPIQNHAMAQSISPLNAQPMYPVPQAAPSQVTQPTAPQYVLPRPRPAVASPLVHIQPVESTDNSDMMRIVADSSGQRSDGMSSNVAKLFAPQQPAVASPIPGSQPVAVPQPIDAAVIQVGYDEPISNVEPATYTLSDSNPTNSVNARVPTIAIRPNRASLLAPTTADLVTPRRAESNSNNTISIEPATAWHKPLDIAIRELDSQLANGTESSVELEQRIRLHLMKLVAGDEVSGQLDLTDAAPARRQFWEHQIRALEILLNQDDSQSVAVRAAHQRRSTMAAEQLEMASDHLANESGMRLNNCAFSTEVLGFGQFRSAIGPYQSGQQLLIYCEIENYTLRNAEGQHKGQGQALLEAELKGLYSIVDQDNRVVHQYEFQTVKDVTTRRRNDFYMFFPVTLPQLPVGRYQLHLSVEDRIGKKFAGSGNDLSFEIGAVAATASRSNPRQQNNSTQNYRTR